MRRTDRGVPRTLRLRSRRPLVLVPPSRAPGVACERPHEVATLRLRVLAEVLIAMWRDRFTGRETEQPITRLRRDAEVVVERVDHLADLLSRPLSERERGSALVLVVHGHRERPVSLSVVSFLRCHCMVLPGSIGRRA